MRIVRIGPAGARAGCLHVQCGCTGQHGSSCGHSGRKHGCRAAKHAAWRSCLPARLPGNQEQDARLALPFTDLTQPNLLPPRPPCHYIKPTPPELTPTVCATASPSARLMASPGTQLVGSQTRSGPTGRPRWSTSLQGRETQGKAGVRWGDAVGFGGRQVGSVRCRWRAQHQTPDPSPGEQVCMHAGGQTGKSQGRCPAQGVCQQPRGARRRGRGPSCRRAGGSTGQPALAA